MSESGGPVSGSVGDDVVGTLGGCSTENDSSQVWSVQWKLR